MITTVVLIYSLSLMSLASDMLPVEVYAKCHAKLSDHPVDIDSVDYKSVEKGTLDPIDACKKILDRADLISAGSAKRVKNQNDEIATSVLRNFHQFHQSWFSSFYDVNSVLDYAFYNFTDQTEPALFITDALFGNLQYKSVFTRNTSLRGIRIGEATNNYNIGSVEFSTRKIMNGPLNGDRSDFDINNVEEINHAKVTLGKLVGVEIPAPLIHTERAAVYRAPITQNQWPTVLEVDQTYEINQNFGGGILGSPAYIMFNSESVARLDGGTRIHRRMANNTFNDLMCLTLPTLLDSDINAFMEKYKNSELSFRKDRSCARCHASLDPFANIARNLQPIQTSDNTYRVAFGQENPTFTNTLQMSYIKKYHVTTDLQSVSDVDNIYIRRKPEGQLYYRNYKGTLVNQSVNGLQDLGNKVANQEDVYMCAAQRYYGFLTGVNVQVSSNESSDFFKKHKNEIIKVGKNLKTHGSLKTMVIEILKTEAFQTRFPSYELVEEGK